MFDAAAETLKRNRNWLSQSAPSLEKQLNDQAVKGIQFCQRDPDGRMTDCDLFFGKERVLESCNESLNALLIQQLKRTDGVAMPRPLRSSSASTPPDPAAVLAEMVNHHREVLFEHLPSIPSPEALLTTEKPPYRNLVIFGSLMLVTL